MGALFPALFGCLVYPATGLNPKPRRFANFLGVLVLEAVSAQVGSAGGGASSSMVCSIGVLWLLLALSAALLFFRSVPNAVAGLLAPPPHGLGRCRTAPKRAMTPDPWLHLPCRHWAWLWAQRPPPPRQRWPSAPPSSWCALLWLHGGWLHCRARGSGIQIQSWPCTAGCLSPGRTVFSAACSRAHLLSSCI